MINHVNGNKKQNQEDNDQSDRPLDALKVCAVESQIAGNSRMLPSGSKSQESGKAKETLFASFAAIGIEEEEPHKEAFSYASVNRTAYVDGIALGTFHELNTLSKEIVFVYAICKN
jgi:hypothetical protein